MEKTKARQQVNALDSVQGYPWVWLQVSLLETDGEREQGSPREFQLVSLQETTLGMELGNSRGLGQE